PLPTRVLPRTRRRPAYISPACTTGRTSRMADVKVGILVGSESDRERMQGAIDVLEEKGIGWEFDVRSAHRTPDAVAEYARTARSWLLGEVDVRQRRRHLGDGHAADVRQRADEHLVRVAWLRRVVARCALRHDACELERSVVPVLGDVRQLGPLLRHRPVVDL